MEKRFTNAIYPRPTMVSLVDNGRLELPRNAIEVVLQSNAIVNRKVAEVIIEYSSKQSCP